MKKTTHKWRSMTYRFPQDRMGRGKVPGARGTQPLSGWLELASAIEQAHDPRPRC